MRTFSYVALALSTALATPSPAQVPSFPAAQPQTSADQLAAVMRRLATAPTDMYALLQAGELSIKLDDMSAAAAFFARAEKVDPRNGRAKAGMASILVRAERPAEALRYFQMAEGYGLDPSRYAADRGLAYDLVGEQDRAQRDYRLALRTTPADEEIVRRYALSLGISGRQAAALDVLAPQIRRQDRAAWRSRAFVLAMNGDVSGANKIAGAVMPAGMAAGLRPFFERLPSLPASDRAFAVHFGEVRPTPERLADARLKPPLPALGPDSYAPVQVAAVRMQPVAARQAGRKLNRREERLERRAARDRIPVVTSGSLASAVPVAPARVLPTPAGLTPPAATAVQTVSARPFTPPVQGPPAPSASDPIQVASIAPITAASAPSYVAPRPSVAVSTAPVQVAGPAAAPVQVAAAAMQPAPLARSTAPVSTSGSPTQVAAATPGPALAAVSTGTALPVQAPAQPAPQPAALAVAGPPVPTPGAAPGFGDTAPAFRTSVAAPVTAVRSEDSILARIVASITVPGEELGVAQPARKSVAVAAADPATRRTLAAGQARVARETADRAAAAHTIDAAAKVKPDARKATRKSREIAADDADAKPLRSRTGRATLTSTGRSKTLADEQDDAKPARRGRGGKVELASNSTTRGKAAKDGEPSTKPRTAAEKRAAAKRTKADRQDSDEATASKKGGEPERIWVQVAAGAQDRDLPKAWTAAQKKAALLNGRPAYSTASRAINRVVTGPFKTEAEARAFVNRLAKQGVSAFRFKSEAGQKMTKLPAK